MAQKICLISEMIAEPFDEGIKITAFSLVKEFAKKGNFLGITRYGRDVPELNLKRKKINRFLLSPGLFREIRRFHPYLLIYLPYASATLNSFIRNKILQTFGNQQKTAMIALQPRKYTFISKSIIRILKPQILFVQSKKSLNFFNSLNINAHIISSGVDFDKYKPVDSKTKSNLRKKYNIPDSKFIISHVGHLKANRNIRLLKKVQKIPDAMAIFKSSTSTSQDHSLKNELVREGIIIFDSYMENIEEIYQLSDCYFFPTADAIEAIEFPLSVLEAMACNLPVVTMPFGGLTDMFDESDDFLYFTNEDQIPEKINRIKTVIPKNREKIEQFSWSKIAEEIIEICSAYNDKPW